MSKLLTLHRPTVISKLIKEVSEHSSSRPPQNIPQWSDLLPFEKLSDYRCPYHAVELSRGALGELLEIFPSCQHGFDLEDPLMRIAPRGYHPLHDKHLRIFWTEAMKKNLKDRGLINGNGKVMCTIKEFNQFRNFRYLQLRPNLQNRLCQMEADKKSLHAWLEIQNNLSAKQEYNEKLLIRCERTKKIFYEKLNRWKKRIEKYQERTHVLTIERNSRKHQRITEGRQRDFYNKVRCQRLEDLRKRKCLILERRLRDQDAALQQRILTSRRRKADIRLTMRAEHFRMHCLAHARECNEAKMMLEKFSTEMQLKVNKRKEKYRQQHTKLEEALVRRKRANLIRSYKRRSKNALLQALLKECMKMDWKKTSNATPQKTIESAINAAYAIHSTMSHTTSSTLIIDTASQFIKDLRENPGEPLPLDRQTTRYVVDRLREIMEQIIPTTVDMALKHIEQVAVRKSEEICTADQSLQSSLSRKGSGTKVNSARSGHLQSCVSIGPTSVVEQYESNSFSFKKCRNRPPTPITSVTSLVECTFRQPEEERSSVSKLEISADTALVLLRRIHSDDYPLVHIVYSQRRYLESNLIKFRMIVQPYVEQRLLAAIDLQRFVITKQKASGIDKDELLHRTASELLKFPESAYSYANALLDCVNYLSTEAIRKSDNILNAV